MNIGWIGTGVMGAPMAGHLQEDGHQLFVHNRTRSKAENLLENGAIWCDSPAAVAEQSKVLFTIVGMPDDVEQVYLGEDGVLSNQPECQIVVDMTTSQPQLAERISDRAQELGVQSIDAPVSGGDVGAREGTLAIMCGGPKDAFDEVYPLLERMGDTVEYMGGPGSGQHTKMSNQILVAGNMIGVCESLLYAEKQGLDEEDVIDIIGSGAARSFLINDLGPRIVEGDYDPGFYIEHFVKDMGIALRECEACGLSLPGLSLVKQLYTACVAQDRERLGTQGLILALRRLNNMKEDD